MPTSRHCFPGDLPPKSRRLDENPGDFNQASICIRYKLFLTFYIPYFAGYKMHLSIGRMQGPLSFAPIGDYSA